MHRSNLKTVAAYVGKFLGIAGLVFVLYQLSRHYTLESFAARFVSLSSISGELLALNIVSSLIGIYGWHLLVTHYAAQSVSFATSYYYFAKTEISKYLPGNIFHFVGRQALASKIGLRQKEMAKISLLFTLLLAAATVVAAAFLTLGNEHLPFYLKMLSPFLAAGALLPSLLLYPSVETKRKLSVTLLLSVSLILQGGIVALIVAHQMHTSLSYSYFLLLSAVYVLSWLVGFVTPGASGGLGVREGAFVAIVAFLHLHISDDTVVFAVLAIRLLNIVVDILLYLSTLLFSPER